MLRLFRQCFFSLLILSVAFPVHSREKNLYGRYSGPRSLGPYSIDRDISIRSFLAIFGTKPSGKRTYCFADKEHGLYLYAQLKDDISGRVANVLLSSFPNCKNYIVLATTIDPEVWKTPEGIGIGSTKEEVIHAYRKPVFVSELGKMNDVGVIAGIHDPGASRTSIGDSSYLFSCLINDKEVCREDIRATRMGFSKNKLIWIHISNSE